MADPIQVPDGLISEASGSAPDTAERGNNIRSIMNVSLQVQVILGRARMSVNQLLALSNGSVIELDRRIGEPFDVAIGERRVARGEIVRIDETGGLGIKLTEITREYMPSAE